MPIINKELYDEFVKNNSSDAYGNACVRVAKRVMEILDEESGDFDAHELICRADEEVNVGGITGFMAGCIACLVFEVHSRGNEFKTKWNKLYGYSDKEGVVNPAVVTIKDTN